MIVVLNDMMKSISIFLGSTPTLHPADDVVEVVRGSSKTVNRLPIGLDDPRRPYDISSNGARLASPDPPARNFLTLRASTLVR